ncbi:MAG: VWA domain-containing protein [Gemmatimonadales bacterium]
MYRFADPQYLLLALVIPAMGLWYWRRTSRKGATLRYSSVRLLKQATRGGAARYRHALFVLRALALAALIVAFARPQSGSSGRDVLTEGIDIVLAIDVSSSMLAEDLKPNRLYAAKHVAAQFVEGRGSDRIGLVIFAGEAFTQAPLTLDYNVIFNVMADLEAGMIEDGTAIGMGLATAVKRLSASEAKSKVIILVTDGRNNRGEIDPVTAAQMAQALGIKVYTIGAGTRGEAPFPVYDPVNGKRYVNVRVDIDEAPLKKAAALTGGKYFRATNSGSLEKIYEEIDRLEKTEIKVRNYTQYSELFPYPLGLALLLVLMEVTLSNTKLRKIP